MKQGCIKRAKEKTSVRVKVHPILIYSVLFWISRGRGGYEAIELIPKKFIVVYKRLGDQLNSQWTGLSIKLVEDSKKIKGWTVMIDPYNNNKILYIFNEV